MEFSRDDATWSVHPQSHCDEGAVADPYVFEKAFTELPESDRILHLGNIEIQYWTDMADDVPTSASQMGFSCKFVLKHCVNGEAKQSASEGANATELSSQGWFIIYADENVLRPHLNRVIQPTQAVIDPRSPIGLLLLNCMTGLFGNGSVRSELNREVASQSVSLLLAAACNSKFSNSDLWMDSAPDPLRLNVQKIISTHLQYTGLNVTFIANKAGVSRSCLYRLFCKEGGVMQFVRQKRLDAAYQELCDQTASGLQSRVSTIAFRWGFSGPSQFSRAFRQHFGCSPRQARHKALQKVS